METKRPFHLIKAFNFFVYGALAIYSTFFALYLQTIGMTTLEIGALMAGGPIVSITDMGGEASLIGWSAFLSSIFEIPVFLLLDRYLRINVRTMMLCLVGISVLFALRWFLMSGVDSAQQIIYIQMLHCLTFGGYYYIGTQLTSLLVPSEFRASGQAVYALTWGGLSGIAAGFIGGWMFQQVSPQSMCFVCGTMAVAGIIGFSNMYALMRRRRCNLLRA